MRLGEGVRDGITKQVRLVVAVAVLAVAVIVAGVLVVYGWHHQP